MTNKENHNHSDEQESNGDLSSSVSSFWIFRDCLLQPLGPPPDLCVDGPIKDHQDHHGHEMQEQGERGSHLQYWTLSYEIMRVCHNFNVKTMTDLNLGSHCFSPNVRRGVGTTSAYVKCVCVLP